MSRVWIPRQDLTLAVIALLFVVCTNPARGEGVRIERGQVRIVLASSPQKNALTASIRTSFVLHNTSDRADGARRVFPIAAPLTWRHQRTGMTWCSVAVDDELVEATTEALLDSQSRVRGQPDDKQHILWSERIDKWIEEDDVLLELVTRFRKLTESRREINDVTEEFQQRARRHLIHADDLDYTVVYVASGDSFFGHLVKLMPEIDPKLRIDGEHRRWKYVSILNEFDPELYRPYEQAWRSQFDKWISSKPELAELSPKLRDVWGSLRESQELLHGPILKHLHDVNQLDLITSQEMASFIDRGGQSPTTSLVRKMFPDIRRQLDAKDEAATKQLSKWGFDESTISPFTGRLTPRRDAQPLAVRDFWRDPSVLAQLGRPSPPPQRRGRARRELYVPVLVSFDAPLKAGETAAVTLEHEIDLVPLVHPLSSSFRTGGSALSTVFPAAGNVAVTVTCPAGIQPIIAPAPHTIDVAKDGLRTFHGRLGGDATMVHLAPVDLTKDGAPWLSRFPNRDGRVHQDLSELIEKTRNRTVRPLLMSALYSSLLDAKKPWEAEQLAARISRDHPDFGTLLKSLQSNMHKARRARELHEWVLEKCASPRLKSDDDLKRFQQRSSNDNDVLTPVALAELASRVALLEEDELDFDERMGRRFIFCQAGIDTESNLAALLKLAKSHPKTALESLKLIQHLSIADKSAALPFVLAQIDVKLREKARAGKVTSTSFEWRRQNAAYHALSTFRSPQAAAGIIQFIHRAGDALLVQGATQALAHMTLPDRFDELAGIADHVAAASESAFIQYLDLVLRSDPSGEKALPLLNSLRERHPRLAPRVMRALGRAGYRMQLSEALAAYRTSNDIKVELPSAIEVIADLANPQDIATLKYRRGLPDWMGERLVSIVRFKGGDKTLYPFVESYYLEHVRGKEAHNHLTCVAAFERIGDSRAIRRLREIFDTTERKRDAAVAIGHLQLPRAARRPPTDNPLDLPWRNATAPNTSAADRGEAWRVLLADPEGAFRRAMQYGALRSAIDNPEPAWYAADRDRVAFVARFGDVAARGLLKESEGCSLPQRYRLAELLRFVLPESRAIVEQDASDASIDRDRRLTAQRALRLGPLAN